MMMRAYDTELAVIGGGPAGLAAAIAAAKNGVEVTVVDENMRAGGQLFKQIHKFFGSHRHMAGIRGYRIGEKMLEELEELRVNTLLSTVVMGIFEDNVVGIYREGEVSPLRAKKLIIATGAIENPLKFAGWTLPGVMGAGAVQTMINTHGVLPGEKVLMVGTGNVGLIVTYQLLQAGAAVVGIVEALPAVSGWHVHAAKVCRLGIPIYLSHTVVEAKGEESVEGVVMGEVGEGFEVKAGSEKELEVDLICIAVGLRPLIELARLASCKIGYVGGLGGFLPLHDETMKSSQEGVYIAGDCTGIEEASTSMEEGRLAGLSCAYELGKIKRETYDMSVKLINTNMMALRIGSFGDERQRCKDEIYRAYGAIR
jgi:NADPH-dependent 2,4-dienoyl-CoA reductase/sulfur reductase-like enzyme